MLQEKTNTEYEVSINLNEDNIFNYSNKSDRFINGKNNTVTFTGTRFGETIDTSGITQPLTIKAGAGVNTIVVDNSSSFDITVAEEKLNAKNIIKFKNDIDTNYAFTRHGNDLIISKGTNSKVTINGYFIERDDKTKYADIVFKIANETKTFEQLVYITGKEFITQVSGKYTSNVDGAYIVGSTEKILYMAEQVLKPLMVEKAMIQFMAEQVKFLKVLISQNKIQ